jgi:HD-GYP domain-containing protein (c-di-GMP phosphodiesterase class II)/DNA-binding LacI/PurR family transcriptional regulator
MRSSIIGLKQQRTVPAARTRPTIGLITDWIDDQYQLDILNGINDLAKERDANLLCFEGGALYAENALEARGNIVYELANHENVDGLIIGPLGIFASLNEVIRFSEKYQPLPLVSINFEIPGVPLCVIDDYGIRELVVHLIEAHGYRNFAVIKSPGTKRYDIFRETLAEFRIPADENLIVQGDYTMASGEQAVKILLDQRRAKFEAIIACNDAMAVGALRELKARGIKVPGEVAVVGFDNFDIGIYSSPPLTTVGASIYELGRRAAEILLDLLAGKKTPLLEVVPSQLIIRESCGCNPRVADKSTFYYHSGSERCPEAVISSLISNHEIMVAKIVESIQPLFFNIKRINIRNGITRLLDTFRADLAKPQNNTFLITWAEILDSVLNMKDYLNSWHRVLSELRSLVWPYLQNRQILIKARDLLEQAQIILNEKTLFMEISTHREIVQANRELSFLREKLLASADEEQAMELLAHTLPELGIKSCYLVMFEGNKQEKARLILAYDEHGRKGEHEKRVFASHTLLPDTLRAYERRFTMLAVAINLTISQLGFILFEMGPPDGRFYSELRRIIGSTIQTALLFQEIWKLANRLRVQKEHLSSNLSQSRRVIVGFIEAIALTVETRDPYTAGHQHRVAELAAAIAAQMKLPPDRIEGIRMAGTIHDLGKISVPSEILNKPGQLTPLELSFIKNHPEIAYQILKNIDFPWPIARIILQHHEKIDGSGYPYGLKGANILLEAKILAVADVVEAKISYRTYRAALSLENALAEIEEKQGLLYDPEVVKECIKLFRVNGFQFT